MSYLSRLDPGTMYQVSKYLNPSDLENLKTLDETSESLNSDVYRRSRNIDEVLPHLLNIPDIYVIEQNGRLISLNTTGYIQYPCKEMQFGSKDWCQYSPEESIPKIREYLVKGSRFRIPKRDNDINFLTEIEWFRSRPGFSDAGNNMYINSKVLIQSL